MAARGTQAAAKAPACAAEPAAKARRTRTPPAPEPAHLVALARAAFLPDASPPLRSASDREAEANARLPKTIGTGGKSGLARKAAIATAMVKDATGRYGVVSGSEEARALLGKCRALVPMGLPPTAAATFVRDTAAEVGMLLFEVRTEARGRLCCAAVEAETGMPVPHAFVQAAERTRPQSFEAWRDAAHAERRRRLGECLSFLSALERLDLSLGMGDPISRAAMPAARRLREVLEDRLSRIQHEGFGIDPHGFQSLDKEISWTGGRKALLRMALVEAQGAPPEDREADARAKAWIKALEAAEEEERRWKMTLVSPAALAALVRVERREIERRIAQGTIPVACQRAFRCRYGRMGTLDLIEPEIVRDLVLNGLPPVA